jgi:hypothetical protein
MKVSNECIPPIFGKGGKYSSSSHGAAVAIELYNTIQAQLTANTSSCSKASFHFCIFCIFFANRLFNNNQSVRSQGPPPQHTARAHAPGTQERKDVMSDQGQTALESALIGCFGGLFATFCVYPLDLVKSKVSGQKTDDEGPPMVGWVATHSRVSDWLRGLYGLSSVSACGLAPSMRLTGVVHSLGVSDWDGTLAVIDWCCDLQKSKNNAT